MPSLKIPPMGLGTWENKDPESIAKAIEIGYRHIDTAQVYFNEEVVGEGIKISGISRDEIFLATKVSPTFLGYDDVKRTTEESMKKLGVDYLDLLYIHWPAEAYDPEETFRAFDELVEEGKTKHIAVSNFTPSLLDDAFRVAKSTLVANQVEMHPLLRQKEMRKYVVDHDIYLVAYSPLGQGSVADIPEIVSIAEKHDISMAQVSLSWLLSIDNVIPIPKATGEDHLRENFAALSITLDSDDSKLIESIDDEDRILDPYFAPDW